MAHKIIYLPIAESDVLDAIDYIADKLDAPAAAADLIAELDNTVKRIATLPTAISFNDSYPNLRIRTPLASDARFFAQLRITCYSFC